MSPENALLDFLYDHPWSSQAVLELVFGEAFSRLATAKEIRVITVPGVGDCWAVHR